MKYQNVQCGYVIDTCMKSEKWYLSDKCDCHLPFGEDLYCCSFIEVVMRSLATFGAVMYILTSIIFFCKRRFPSLTMEPNIYGFCFAVLGLFVVQFGQKYQSNQCGYVIDTCMKSEKWYLSDTCSCHLPFGEEYY
jgi:hypothetical protein